MTLRLQRILANAGLCSRRAAEDWLRAGRVRVNGRVASVGESADPGRDRIERWTLQASAPWSLEHLRDDSSRIEAKLLRAFAEITGIRTQPSFARTRCWPEAQTQVPLGKPHLWDGKTRLGLAGDWCMGHRVEDAFLSGLSLALAAL